MDLKFHIQETLGTNRETCHEDPLSYIYQHSSEHFSHHSTFIGMIHGSNVHAMRMGNVLNIRLQRQRHPMVNIGISDLVNQGSLIRLP